MRLRDLAGLGVSIALLLGGVVGFSSAVAGCGGTCKGTVQRLEDLGRGQVRVVVHNNTETGRKATFCTSEGPIAHLGGCTAGALYPKCTK